jgi:putative FmdB family regulatory protein
MPIYEFYCPHCHMLFNFFSHKVNTAKRPLCPRCGKAKLEREVSSFSLGGRSEDPGEGDDIPFDEQKMERAMTALAGEAESINEDDP